MAVAVGVHALFQILNAQVCRSGPYISPHNI